MEAAYNTTLSQLPLEEPFIAEKLVKSYCFHVESQSVSSLPPKYTRSLEEMIINSKLPFIGILACPVHHIWNCDQRNI